MDALVVIIVVNSFICAVLGAAIGGRRDSAGNGAILGFLFGEIGLIVAFALDGRPECPNCGERVNRNARLCSHCRSAIYWWGDQQFETQEKALAKRAKELEADRVAMAQLNEAIRISKAQSAAFRKWLWEFSKNGYKVLGAALRWLWAAAWAGGKVLGVVSLVPFRKVDESIWLLSGRDSFAYRTLLVFLTFVIVCVPILLWRFGAVEAPTGVGEVPQSAVLTVGQTSPPAKLALEPIPAPQALTAPAERFSPPVAPADVTPDHPVSIPEPVGNPAPQAWEILIPASPPLKYVKSLDTFTFQCKSVGWERSQLAPFNVNGEWRATPDGVMAIGRHSALMIADTNEFQVEADVTLSKHGGWFWLVGWTGKEGYLIVNAGHSSDTWGFHRVSANLVENKLLHSHGRKLIRGRNAVSIRLEDSRLSFQVGPMSFLEQFPIPEYRGGAIVTGTFPSPSPNYGSREVTIHSLRARLKVD